MSLILQIDTHLEKASVSLALKGKCIGEKFLKEQKDQAAFLQPAIRDLLNSKDYELKDLSAVSVISGPGSYTGLRVGMASAKGLCFALGIPLITIGSLEWMAAAAAAEESELLAPMIDARRNEVFMAVYRKNGEIFLPPTAIILEKESFQDILQQHKVLFFGNGAQKFQIMISNINAIFKAISPGCDLLAALSWRRFEQSLFADLAYSEPLYVKAFYSATPPFKDK